MAKAHRLPPTVVCPVCFVEPRPDVILGRSVRQPGAHVSTNLSGFVGLDSAAIDADEEAG
jgi:hypothetical protein